MVFLEACAAGALPPEGVVEVGLDAAVLATFVVVGLAAAGELLAALEVEGLLELVGGREGAGVPDVVLMKRQRNRQ